MMFEKSTMIAHLILTQQKHDHHCQLTLTFYKSTNSNDFELGTNDVCKVLYKNPSGEKNMIAMEIFLVLNGRKIISETTNPNDL